MVSNSSPSSEPQSLGFDRAAPRYDATRGYPLDVAEQIGAAIIEAAAAAADTRFLEVGVGTGRIALPVARQGYDYTGVDISALMLDRLRAKVTELQQSATSTARPIHLQLVMADMTALPFPNASFDVVVAVHVFHLVRAWKQAVEEVLRVLRSGGVFLHCWDEYLSGDEALRERWVQIVRELGGEVGIIGAERRSAVTDYLRERGFTVEVLRTVIWETQESPRAAFDYIAQRVWSRTWLVPDDIFAASIQRLESWATNRYGAAYTIPRPQTYQFIISRTRR
ncbi:MAG TPA: class I SAM-dependent methyltransferase [Ktedonobacterales bacterium]|nr:class I SAM-dependent methyltransferase [Ktedonobacterales bacterium]